MKEELRKLIQEEAEHSELHMDDDYEIPPGTKVSRPGQARSVVFSVRLNPDEVEAVNAAAERQEVPPSTIARGWILRGLRGEPADSPAALVEHLAHDVDRLRELVSNH